MRGQMGLPFAQRRPCLEEPGRLVQCESQAWPWGHDRPGGALMVLPLLGLLAGPAPPPPGDSGGQMAWSPPWPVTWAK